MASEEFSLSEEMNLIRLDSEIEEMRETVVEPGTPNTYLTPSSSRNAMTRSAINMRAKVVLLPVTIMYEP